jgi:hypothetical protein
MLKRFFEPSTWAGLAAVALGAKMVMPPPWNAVADAVAVAAGGLAMALREKGKAPSAGAF